MSNDLIIANLQVLLKDAQEQSRLARQNKDPKNPSHFRVRAYQNAIKAIKNCTFQLESGKDAAKLEGVGKKTAEKIQEIIDTGKLHQVEELGGDQLEQTKTITEFTSIWGVGPVKAKELWSTGARSIKDIRKNYEYLLNDNQRVGLKYHEDLKKRVPRWEVTEIAKKILTEIKQIERDLQWKIQARICGSYRRKAETCGDMDILLCESDNHPILSELVDRLATQGILIENLGIGPTKYMGITRTGTGTAFRIDMEVIKPHEWPFALLYFTGSGSFNEKQRLVAKKMGYSLSEHGLKDTDLGTYVKDIRTEKQIFDFLGMEYLAPWERG